MPFSNPQARQHLDHQIDQAVRVDFGLALFHQQCVLFVDRLAHRPDAASQGLFSQDAFLRLERFEHSFAMSVQRVQAGCARALGQLGWGRSELTTRCSWGTASTGVSRPAIVAALIGAFVAALIAALIATFVTAFIPAAL